MCSSNLAKIGQALLNYAPSDSSGPAHLEKLVEQGILKRGEIICPASQGGVSNYILTQSFARPDHADAGVLVYEPLSNHGDGMNVFFAGGQCKFVLKAQIGQLGIPLP